MTTSSDRLDRIEAILAATAEQQAADRAEWRERLNRIEAAQERTQQQANETEQTADDNAQYLGETRAMLEQAIHGFRADIQAITAVFAENLAAIRQESNDRHDESDQRHAESEARHAEHDQRFNNLLEDARADRQRQDQRHQEWMQRFDEQLAEMRRDREANTAEHRAFTQNVQTLLAEISRIWQRLSA